MSNIDKQALRERYSEKPAPKCHICGSVMTIQRAGAGSVVYGCTGRIDKDGEGYKFAEGRDFADDHYARSRVTVPDESDPDVLALLDEMEATYSRIGELEVIATDYGMKFQKAQDAMKHQSLLHKSQMEAAEKRIAELSQKADIYDMLRQDYELQGSLVEFVDWQAKRIADLESREVKLPEFKMLRDYLVEVTHREREDILVGVRLEFFRALEEAGVKVAVADKGE